MTWEIPLFIINMSSNWRYIVIDYCSILQRDRTFTVEQQTDDGRNKLYRCYFSSGLLLSNIRNGKFNKYFFLHLHSNFFFLFNLVLHICFALFCRYIMSECRHLGKKKQLLVWKNKKLLSNIMSSSHIHGNFSKFWVFCLDPLLFILNLPII